MRRSDYAFFGLSLVAAAGLLGCNNREISEVIPNQDKEEFKDIPVQLNRDVDILFVVDNSGSMEGEQISLAANLPAFINVLETIEGGLPNVHIGVVSSDMGAGPFNITGCNGNGDGGQLQTQARVAGCSPPTGAYISDISDSAGGRTTNYTGTLAETFTCIARLGTDGCGFEQQLESMRAALDGSQSFNNGFIRDSAYLAVIFVSDEDDCSTRDNQMFDTSQEAAILAELGPLSSFRCFEFGVDCDTGNGDPRAPGPRSGCFPREDSQYMYGVQEYVEFLKTVKGDDSLIIVANIVGNVEPVTVGVDPERPTNPALVPSCQSGAAPNVSKADPAVRLQFLAQQFPNRNAFTTICNEDLTDGLILIAELLKEAIGNPCIEGLLRDANGAVDGLQPECVVADVVNPGTDDQIETILPHCNADEDLDTSNTPNSTNLPCWHLDADTESCPETPTNLTLLVERGGASVQTGTHVQARCVNCVDGDGNGVCDDEEQ